MQILFSGGGSRRTHATQPPKMGFETGAEGDVLSVLNAEISAGLFHQVGNGWVVDVADLWEEMMFDLKIQAAQQPALHPAAAGKVHRRFGLMDGPGICYGTRICSRQWELSLLNAVR